MREIQINQELGAFCERLLPRMLTQVCRDPGSPAYGSFDRNWWHYKIRDFSSIILQQGGYALYCASLLPQFRAEAEQLKELAVASCRFWNLRAKKHGAFEEYYPWEQGYPPLAFSTLAVAKMVSAGIVEADEVFQGLEKAAKQLQFRFESKATNQQVAGIAALCWIRKITPHLIDEAVFQDMCSRTLACQHQEGWFMEYGGPDLGYLSVTMDCLWDAYDATGDERFRTAAANALKFIAPFTALPMRGAGMHNARNTDYIVPYGIARFLEDDRYAETASMILFQTLETINSPEHFVQAIDDRYFCHYIGHSFFRAANFVEGLSASGRSAEGEKGEPADRWFSGTGHWLRSETRSGCAALISAKKGGIFTLSFDDVFVSDFGWVVKDSCKEWVSHWWADFWRFERADNRICIRGYLTPHKENESTPLKHVILRGLSLVLGTRIIELLKKVMIFKPCASSPFPFSRTILFDLNEVVVVDEFFVPPGAAICRAPRSSKRHVASADSFHFEDLIGPVFSSVDREESRSQQGRKVNIRTVYRKG
jgi:hypothetical protein